MISQIIWSSNIEAIVGSIKKSKNIFLSENLKTRDEVVNFSLEDRKYYTRHVRKGFFYDVACLAFLTILPNSWSLVILREKFCYKLI